MDRGMDRKTDMLMQIQKTVKYRTQVVGIGIYITHYFNCSLCLKFL
jgi:hypothetical protein